MNNVRSYFSLIYILWDLLMQTSFSPFFLSRNIFKEIFQNKISKKKFIHRAFYLEISSNDSMTSKTVILKRFILGIWNNKYYRLKMHARTSSLLTILSCTFQLSSLLTSTCQYYAAKSCQLGVSLASRSCQLGAYLVWSQVRMCLIMLDCWFQLTILTYAHLYQVKSWI